MRHCIKAKTPVEAENLCHQAIFMDHVTSAVTPLDPELVQNGDAGAAGSRSARCGRHLDSDDSLLLAAGVCPRPAFAGGLRCRRLGGHWVTLADPEGNESDLIESLIYAELEGVDLTQPVAEVIARARRCGRPSSLPAQLPQTGRKAGESPAVCWLVAALGRGEPAEITPPSRASDSRGWPILANIWTLLARR